MYIPKNRIKTNLYTPGYEFIIRSTGENYKGSYHSIYSGTFYTGKTQNDSNIREIIRFAATAGEGTPDLPQNQSTTNIIALFLKDPDPMVNTEIWNQGDIVTYLQLQGKSTIDDDPKKMPQQFYPKPTEDDYLLGSFTRYFAVKVNELQYLELDLPTFQKLKKRDVGWVYLMYTIFSIQWTLTGDQEEVARTNKNQILIAEQNLNRLGLNNFLKEDYLKFYKYNEQTSLFTEGGEYINRTTGQEYIGYYHIHSLKGPMVGQFHTSTNHSYLDPIISTTSTKTTDSPITGSASPPPPTNSGYSSPSGGGY